LSLAGNSRAHMIMIESENLERDIDIPQDIVDAIEHQPMNKMTKIFQEILFQRNSLLNRPDKP
jgi:ATP-dependent Lon protease